jgi:hypothetical protein
VTPATLARQALEGHAAPHRGDGEPDADGREQHQQMGLVPDLAAVAELECVEEVAARRAVGPCQKPRALFQKRCSA